MTYLGKSSTDDIIKLKKSLRPAYVCFNCGKIFLPKGLLFVRLLKKANITWYHVRS